MDESETLSWYFVRARETQSRSTCEGTRTLDPIPASLVGMIDIKRVRAAAVRFVWAKEALHLLLHGDIQGMKCHGTDTPQSATHIGRQVPLSELRALGIIGSRSPQMQSKPIGAYCGLFLVPKGSHLMRLICDARPANSILPRLSGFRLFSLEELLWTFTMLKNESKPMFSVLRDFRHYFYQFRMPPQLQRFFVLSTDGGEEVMHVLPMGYHNSPQMAQTTSWMVVLFKEPAEDPLGIPEQLGTEMPNYIILRKKGGELLGAIFIIIDNIMVLTLEKELAQRWSERLNRNAARFNIVFKTQARDHSAFFKLSEDRVCTFHGVEFSDQGWRPASREAVGVEAGTKRLRQVASWVGQIYWRIRIRQTALCELRHLTALARSLGIVAGTSPIGWTDTIDVSADMAGSLGAIDVETLSEGWTIAELPDLSSALVVAVDATPTRRSGVQLELQTSSVLDYWADNVPHANIHRQEVLAIEDAQKRLKASVLLVLTDSEIARLIFNKRHARSPDLDEIVERTLHRGKVFAWRVPTSINVADTPTRSWPPLLEEARLDASLRVAQAAWTHWHYPGQGVPSSMI